MKVKLVWRNKKASIKFSYAASFCEEEGIVQSLVEEETGWEVITHCKIIICMHIPTIMIGFSLISMQSKLNQCCFVLFFLHLCSSLWRSTERVLRVLVIHHTKWCTEKGLQNDFPKQAKVDEISFNIKMACWNLYKFCYAQQEFYLDRLKPSPP